jgi:peptidoglycan hydrolase-like protein with peptidoglycan-binding domain
MRLTLTSPHTKGHYVTALQILLENDGYLQGSVDGEFGPDTARAVYRAKYWLGYRKPDQVAGDYLYALLKGTKGPTPVMKAIIARRRKIAAQKPIRIKMVDEAHKWLGTKESPPNSNHVLFSRWYGIVGSWCAMFVSYCGVRVSSKAFKRGSFYAYVPYMVNDAKAGRNSLSVTYNPQMGDIVTYDWPGESPGIADHVGLFLKWTNRSAGEFQALEGNTAVGNNSDGGEVMVRDRNKSNVVCFIHVGR